MNTEQNGHSTMTILFINKCCKIRHKLLSVTGYFALSTSQVMCEEFSQCYDDVNICLWTNGSALNQYEAQTACQRRNNSFLPRITDSNIQSKMAEFRSAAGDLLGNNGFWIDVYATDSSSSFQWIDGSQLPGWFVYNA